MIPQVYVMNITLNYVNFICSHLSRAGASKDYDTPEHQLLLVRNQLEKQKGLFSSNSPPLPLSN